ncbi:hypothetical protein J8I87_00710 [Paraburkholderia sp. LEh10]|uniref:hypothetical protein n=1 Tax=Paraburkholderia sp. LEh10 TaxID=2821353 RepID=UPI001AE3835A|nr:hypothetical protein [Paraburkholderia sp. LEh10]MBP0588264.1 hypothetical protein [Paraburkholderia sp. LEh10]
MKTDSLTARVRECPLCKTPPKIYTRFLALREKDPRHHCGCLKCQLWTKEFSDIEQVAHSWNKGADFLISAAESLSVDPRLPGG